MGLGTRLLLVYNFKMDLIPCRPVVFNTSNLFNLHSLSLSISIDVVVCYWRLTWKNKAGEIHNHVIVVNHLQYYSSQGLGVKFTEALGQGREDLVM